MGVGFIDNTQHKVLKIYPKIPEYSASCISINQLKRDGHVSVYVHVNEKFVRSGDKRKCFYFSMADFINIISPLISISIFQTPKGEIIHQYEFKDDRGELSFMELLMDQYDK